MDIKIDKFCWDEIETAPDCVGIYAWYLCPEVRKIDIEDFEKTKENLMRIARQVRFPDMKVNARGHLSMSLSGYLEHDCLGSVNNEDLSRLVDDVIGDDETRSFFANILKNSMPYYMSPLYIGVATNLKQRLSQHKADILSFRKANITKYNEITEVYSHKFALEVVARGIPNSRLTVFTQSINAGEDKKRLTRKSVEAVETVLNRMFFPILGRR